MVFSRGASSATPISHSVFRLNGVCIFFNAIAYFKTSGNSSNLDQRFQKSKNTLEIQLFKIKPLTCCKYRGCQDQREHYWPLQ